jgi:hypothetical protein
MSTDRDTTRIVRSWLRTDGHESADRVLDAVLDQLDTTPQRRAGWPAWRTPTMNRFLTIGLGAAAVVLLLVVGFQFFGSPGNGGLGAGPTPTAQATATPDPTAEATPEPTPEGAHTLWEGSEGGVRIAVTLPAPDWVGEPGGGFVEKGVNGADPPRGAGMIAFDEGEYYVYGDPCQWSTTIPDAPATTVDELVAAMTAQASRDASEPVDITVDGYAGKSITLHVPDNANFSECDQGEFASFGMATTDPDGLYRTHQGPGQIDELYIVDVNGVLAVIDIAYYEATPQSVVDELHAIVESTTFGE